MPCEDVAAARGRAVGLASCVVRWLMKGEPMPAWIFPSPEGTALEERNVRTVFARLLAKADMRQICIHAQSINLPQPQPKRSLRRAAPVELAFG